MQQTEFDFYTRIKNENVVASKSVPKIVLRSNDFQALLESKIIQKEKKLSGFIYKIAKEESFEKFYLRAFPNPDIVVLNETDNQMKFKNTKATSIEKERVVLIRGFGEIFVNNILVDIGEHTENFGLFATVLQSIKADKICFVENVEPFYNAEKILGKEYIFIHFYGRLPKADVLKKIECSEYLHFGDYDYVGLSEFLRASQIYPNAYLYMPDNFDAIFDTYAKERKEKDSAYKNVLESKHHDVVRVRYLLQSGRFLEQQIFFGENL